MDAAREALSEPHAPPPPPGDVWTGATRPARRAEPWRDAAAGLALPSAQPRRGAATAGAAIAGRATAWCFLTFYSSRDRNGICLRLGITSCDCAGEG